MSEDGSEERETAHKMWLSEKITSLENENAELKKALLDMEVRLALQENAMKQAAERVMAMEAAIGQNAEHAQRQDMVIESSRVSIQGLVDEVNIHRDNFQKIGMIMQIHEQYIVPWCSKPKTRFSFFLRHAAWPFSCQSDTWSLFPNFIFTRLCYDFRVVFLF